jgi:2-polyprenyl-3-methyl-5-hydroxy-6-metoxy-1,4-benzoquinol methylase
MSHFDYYYYYRYSDCNINEYICVGTHDWQKYIRSDDLTVMLESSSVGLKVDNISGLVPKPDLVNGGLKWELSKNDVDVNYIVHAIKV